MTTYQLKVTKPTIIFVIAVLTALGTWVTTSYTGTSNAGLAANIVTLIGVVISFLSMEAQATAAGAAVLPKTIGNNLLICAIVVFAATAVISVFGVYVLKMTFGWDEYEEFIGLLFGFVFLILGMVAEGEL